MTNKSGDSGHLENRNVGHIDSTKWTTGERLDELKIDDAFAKQYVTNYF
jgi:hypothetical protein